MRFHYYYSLVQTAIRIAFLSFIEYPLDTLIWIISMLVRESTGFIGILLIAGSLGGLGGWNLYEISMLFSMGMMIEALGQSFFDSIWNIGGGVRKGRFDIYLIRPAPIFFQLLISRVMLQAIASFVAAFLLFVYSWIQLGYGWNIGKSLFFIEFLICGCMINSSIYLCFNSLNFWIVQGNDISGLVQTIREFAKYPLHIFPVFIRGFLTYVLPFGFVGYYPASYLMGKSTKFMPLIFCLAAIFISILANLIWRKGLSAYESTGT